MRRRTEHAGAQLAGWARLQGSSRLGSFSCLTSSSRRFFSARWCSTRFCSGAHNYQHTAHRSTQKAQVGVHTSCRPPHRSSSLLWTTNPRTAKHAVPRVSTKAFWLSVSSPKRGLGRLGGRGGMWTSQRGSRRRERRARSWVLSRGRMPNHLLYTPCFNMSHLGLMACAFSET